MSLQLKYFRNGKQKNRGIHFRTQQKITRKVWDKVTSDYLERLYELLPRPMAAVVLAEGGHTKYWSTQKQSYVVIWPVNQLFSQQSQNFFPR